MSKIGKIFVALMIAILYLVPIVGIYYVSYLEKETYKEEEILLQEKAYGEICQVMRSDIRESITLTAVGVGGKIVNIGASGEVNWLVYEGSEVYENQILGYEDGKKIKSKCDGIVKKIHNNWILVEDFSEIKLEAYVPADEISCFEDKLYDQDGNRVKDVLISNQVLDGKVRVNFSLQNYEPKYGEQFDELILYGEKEYKDVLIIEQSCIYYNEQDGKYYVRVVDESGNVQMEQEVEIGYQYENMVCVEGIEEGTYCDGGYSYFEDISTEDVE